MEVGKKAVWEAGDCAVSGESEKGERRKVVRGSGRSVNRQPSSRVRQCSASALTLRVSVAANSVLRLFFSSCAASTDFAVSFFAFFKLLRSYA